MQLRIMYNLSVWVVFFLILLSLAFIKVPDRPFCVCCGFQLSLQYGVLQDSAFSTETSAAQINYVCLVSIAFTFYPSSYTSLMLGTSLPTVSSGNRGKENTWKACCVPVW